MILSALKFCDLVIYVMHCDPGSTSCTEGFSSLVGGSTEHWTVCKNVDFRVRESFV